MKNQLLVVKTTRNQSPENVKAERYSRLMETKSQVEFQKKTGYNNKQK